MKLGLPSLSPTRVVNIALYAALLVLLSGLGFGVYFLHSQLSAYAVTVDHLKTDSELNQQSLENAQKLRRALQVNADSVERAAEIVADTKYYEYQDQIVKDISSYATATGITVLGFDFSTSTTAKTTNVPGLNTVVVSISLRSPVQYSSYLRFLKLIERNLTKMQVTQLDISNDLKTAGTISSPVITVEAFVR
ncbi:TPA: hypothetical protein DCF80_01545 [Candidatus Saccharibacteria bacterium]|nr:hypothetical protein [Candidatus Saccharibacteria bacterium]HRK40765.1 hypothetical protein [Candidatus Saccharibacteria bacterium]